MEDDILENEVIKSKKSSVGTVYLLQMPNNMLAVIAFDNDKNSVCSRSFFYTEKLKKQILKEAREYFKTVLDCFQKRDLNLLEELDLF